MGDSRSGSRDDGRHAAGPRAVDEDPVSPPAGRETILLVDDDRAVREVTRRILDGRGYTVLTATSGEEALDLALSLEEAPDLLLTDVVMPGIGGERLATEVREIFPGIPVLFMSGYTESKLVHGASDDSNFVPKPFDPDTLARCVREVLDGPRES